MKIAEFTESFADFMAACPVEAQAPGARYVFMSDLHFGDGGSRDDLEPNRDLVLAALADYLDRGHVLVLNGDIEDLHKFAYRDIRAAWPGAYELLDAFAAAGRLRKILGNHDLRLAARDDHPYELLHGLRIATRSGTIFSYHGHQASRFFSKHHYADEFIAKRIAKTLKIRNTSIAGSSRYRYVAERRLYRASKRLGILSITGHTHRPLFESLSKYDSLRFSVEDLVREFPTASPDRREAIASLVGVYRAELSRLDKKDRHYDYSRGLYEEGDFVIPCLFNSGCATGRQGMTALELSGDELALVHWGRSAEARPYLEREAESVDRVGGAFSRYRLKSASLEGAFARIALLGREEA